MVISGRLIVHAPVGDGGFHWGERAKATAWQSVELYMEYCEDNSNLVRFHIIRNARIENVGKSQSCMVSKLADLQTQDLWQGILQD